MFWIVEKTIAISGWKKIIQPFHTSRSHQTYSGKVWKCGLDQAQTKSIDLQLLYWKILKESVNGNFYFSFCSPQDLTSCKSIFRDVPRKNNRMSHLVTLDLSLPLIPRGLSGSPNNSRSRNLSKWKRNNQITFSRPTFDPRARTKQDILFLYEIMQYHASSVIRINNDPPSQCIQWICFLNLLNNIYLIIQGWWIMQKRT